MVNNLADIKFRQEFYGSAQKMVEANIISEAPASGDKCRAREKPDAVAGNTRRYLIKVGARVYSQTYRTSEIWEPSPGEGQNTIICGCRTVYLTRWLSVYVIHTIISVVGAQRSKGYLGRTYCSSS